MSFGSGRWRGTLRLGGLVGAWDPAPPPPSASRRRASGLSLLLPVARVALPSTLAPIPCSMISKAFQGRKGRAYLFSDV